jgi:hypothetical protein
MIFSKLFPVKDSATVQQQKLTAIYRHLLRREAAIGGSLFGAVPKGGRREFFCLDSTTCVWHEEWTTTNGEHKVLNTRYDIRPTGILKAQNGHGYQMVGLDEALRLQAAVKAYSAKVKSEIYHVA